MSVTVLPREKGFGELIGESFVGGATPMLQQQLSDFYQQQKNQKFYKGLAEQLGVEDSDKFASTFANLSPDQFGQLVYQSRYTGLPQMLGLGGAPMGEKPVEQDSMKVQEAYSDMLKTLRENLDVTNVGYGAKTAIKSGFTIPTGRFDPKVQAFNAAGASAVTIAEELFREAQGKGLTANQAKYVQDNFKITNDMTRAEAEAVLNQLEKLRKGQLPKDYPTEPDKKTEPKQAEKTDQQQTKKTFESLPSPSDVPVNSIVRDQKTGIRYRTDGKKWTQIR
jgi:hypothetical protein